MVITNNYDPKWSATLNEMIVPVYRANHAFQAVYINEGGTFRLVMQYNESTVWWLHIVSVIGVATIIGYLRFQSGKKVKDFSVSKHEKSVSLELGSVFGETKETQKLYKKIIIFSGLAMVSLHVLWALFIANPNPAWSSEASKGVVFYNSLVAPLAGFLVTLWASIYIKRW